MAQVEKKKKKDNSSFKTYIYRVLKHVHPDTGITSSSSSVMDDIIKDISMRIIDRGVDMATATGSKTLTSKHIQGGMLTILLGELSKHAKSEGTKAITKYNATMNDGNKGKKGPAAVRAGITFTPSRFRTLMKSRTSLRISTDSGIYLAAIAEYMCAEILELAGHKTRDAKKNRIVPRHIFLAVDDDEELSILIRKENILFSGAQERINAKLLPHKKEKQ